MPKGSRVSGWDCCPQLQGWQGAEEHEVKFMRSHHSSAPCQPGLTSPTRWGQLTKSVQDQHLWRARKVARKLSVGWCHIVPHIICLSAQLARETGREMLRCFPLGGRQPTVTPGPRPQTGPLLLFPLTLSPSSSPFLTLSPPLFLFLCLLFLLLF